MHLPERLSSNFSDLYCKVLPDKQFWEGNWRQHQHGVSPEETWSDFLELLLETLCSEQKQREHIKVEVALANNKGHRQTS